MHWSRIIGNMVGYKMGSSLARVYITVKTSQVENFKHGRKNDMVANMATLFVRGVLKRSSSLDNLVIGLGYSEEVHQSVESLCPETMVGMVDKMENVFFVLINK